MSLKFPVYVDRLRGERLEVNLPLESRINVEEIRNELGLPDYVDVNNFQMRKLVAILHASSHIEQFVDKAKHTVKVLAFGGAAIKLHSPSANLKNSPFFRRLKDIDIVTLKAHIAKVVKMLREMGDVYGSEFFHGEASIDRLLNALRGGERYRLRTIMDVEDDGTPVADVMDIFCDKLSFCHEIDVRDRLNAPLMKNSAYTIGLENLIITKAQFIMRVPIELVDEQNGTRFLGKFNSREILFGMEEKDMQDVMALLLDNELGNGEDEISVEKIGIKLKKGWGMRKTVLMNLQNMYKNADELSKRFNIEYAQLDIIKKRLKRLFDTLSSREYQSRKSIFTLSKQWWQDVSEARKSIQPH